MQLLQFDCHGIQGRNAEGEAFHRRFHLPGNHHNVAVDRNKELEEGRTLHYYEL